MNRPTESIARVTLAGLLNELSEVVSLANDGNLAAWERAEAICTEAAQVCRVVQNAIEARPYQDAALNRLERMGMSVDLQDLARRALGMPSGAA